MIKKIVFYGELSKKYGKSRSLNVANTRQMMDALFSIYGPSFKEYIRENEWHIVDGKKTAGNDIAEEQMMKELKNETIHIMPAVQGAGGVFRIITGVVLAVVGVFTGQAWLIGVGASMALGGIASMLTKPPTPSNKVSDEGGGSIYNQAQNTTTQGGAVPLIFGRVQRASSVVIGTDFSSDDIAVLPDATKIQQYTDRKNMFKELGQ